MVKKSSLERQFAALLDQYGIKKPETECLFHKTRKWRFDACWRAEKVAVELDGGIWHKGGHNTGYGLIRDREKQNAAVLLGWKVLRYTPEMMGQAIDDLKQLL